MNTFPTIGRDCDLVLLWAGGRVDMKGVTGFGCRQLVRHIDANPLNYGPLRVTVPMGWEGEFQTDRRGPELESLFAAIEQGFYAGGGIPWSIPGPLATVTDPATGKTTTAQTNNPAPGKLYQYVRERNGGLSTYEFVGLTMQLDDAGRYSGNDVVRQRISFFASFRNEI